MRIIANLVVVAVLVLCVGVALAQDNNRSGGRGGRGGRNRGDDRGMSPQDPSQRGGNRMEGLLRRMDANGNGMLDAEEVAQNPFAERMLTRMGIEPKYPIAIEQILQASTNFNRARGGGPPGGPPPAGTNLSTGAIGVQAGFGFGVAKPLPAIVPGFVPPSSAETKSGGSETKSNVAETKPAATPASAGTAEIANPSTSASPAAAEPAKTPSRKPARFLLPKERLASGLPDWFLRRDGDGDGQVTMAEYSSDWTPALAAEFNHYDLNHDGVITAAECVKAVKRADSGGK